MNIYIHVEISARELDSKLLLGVIAASRGHEVLISDISTLIKGVENGALAPGIFHTKSLTPSSGKIARHQMLVDKGFLITSIDEEGGLIDHGYDTFAKVRYSSETVSQASAVFGWGKEDTETLKRIYPSFSKKFHRTGSPRADLWGARFLKYWGTPEKMPQKPYLLISSNMGSANNIRPLHESIKMERNAGYYQRDSGMFARKFNIVAEDYKMTIAFIEAIRYLAVSNNNFDIVLRPHPVENIEAWKVYLEGIPNIHVVREGSITAWVNNSFAVMHNGCTTALEAVISGTPVITYLPFKQEYAREVPNEIGLRVKTQQELFHAVNKYFSASVNEQQGEESYQETNLIEKKIFLDNAELAADKIIKVWEGLGSAGFSQASSWRKLQLIMKASKTKKVTHSILEKAFPSKFPPSQKYHKFPVLDEKHVRERVECLQSIMGLDGELSCKLLAERSLLIRRNK